MSLDIDISPLWTSINTYFPVFFAVLAGIGGIGLAIKLAEFLLRKVEGMFGR